MIDNPKFIWLVTLAACVCQVLSAQEATAILRPAEILFTWGEPIDLVLTLHNRSATSVALPAYPRFSDGLPKHGVSIAVAGVNQSSSPPTDTYSKILAQRGYPRGPISWGCCGLSPLDGVEPRQTRTLTIFLQQFGYELGPGDYEVTYSIDIHPDPRGQEAFKGRGAFRITILKGGDADLSAALTRHAIKAGDHWSERDALNGLLLVKSTAVIPYLTRTQSGDTEAILAMVRFPANHDAEEFVIQKLRSDDPKKILASLAVLQEWKYVLPEREMWRLLNLSSGLSAARIGAILYAATIPGDPYHAQVRALTTDRDTQVAGVAARVYSKVSTGESVK